MKRFYCKFLHQSKTRQRDTLNAILLFPLLLYQAPYLVLNEGRAPLSNWWRSRSIAHGRMEGPLKLYKVIREHSFEIHCWLSEYFRCNLNSIRCDRSVNEPEVGKLGNIGMEIDAWQKNVQGWKFLYVNFHTQLSDNL